MDVKHILRTYQAVAISIAILLFCVIALLYGVIPSFKNVGELIVSMQVLEKDNASLTNKIEILDRYDETDLKEKLGVVLSAVPGDKGLPALFGTVEEVAGQAGVTLADMNVSGGLVSTASATKQSPLEKQLGTRALPFTVTVVGGLSNMQEFITKVALVRRLMRIRAFSITFPKNDKPLTISLSLDAFYEPYITSLGGVTAVISPLSDEELSTIDTLTSFPLMASSTEAVPLSPITGTTKANPFVR